MRVKLKARNGLWWDYDIYTKSENQFNIYWDWHSFGIGLASWLGDFRIYFRINILWLTIFIGIHKIGR